MLTRGHHEKLWSAHIGRAGDLIPSFKSERLARETEKRILLNLKEWARKRFTPEVSMPIMRGIADQVHWVNGQLQQIDERKKQWERSQESTD